MRTKSAPMPAELITCHDCSKSVSFSAKACPHCGSSEPAGPYQWSRKEARRHNIEGRNDRNMIILAIVLGAVGAFYGASTSASSFGAVLSGFCYGLIGVSAGMCLAFVINVTRSWF
jgi:ribosomal protein L37E